MSPTPRRPPKPKPVKDWQRAEAGRYRSSDERFTLESDGTGRWFVVDEDERDELGLARTSGPFATLGAAKAAASGARDRPAAPSPLAARIADAAGRSRRAPRWPQGARGPTSTPGAAPAARPGPTSGRAPAGESGPMPKGDLAARSWLEDLAEHDAGAASGARKLIAALEQAGIRDADALVRRDLLGDRPAVAARLLARDVVAAIARLSQPTALTIAEAVAGVLASSPSRAGLPGWELVERDGSTGRRRPIRLTGADLTAAAEGE